MKNSVKFISKMNNKIYLVINNHIKKLKVEKNSRIIVHADLSRFGIVNRNLPSLVLRALKNLVGKNGSIIMPAYTIGMPKDYVYNIHEFAKNLNISILSKEFFKTQKVYRSSNPLHNHIGIGKDSDFLLYSSTNSSYGKNSDFYYMYKKNFKLILLGCSPQQGATYLHHLEALFGVPYRKWIKIEKRILVKNKVKKIMVNYYARKNLNYKSDFNSLFDKLKNSGVKINKIKLKFGYSLSVSLKDLHKYSELLLKKNSYAFVKKI